MLGKESVGKYCIDESGFIWEVIAYTDNPTVTLKNVNAPEIEGKRKNIVVGSPISKNFRVLTPEEE